MLCIDGRGRGADFREDIRSLVPAVVRVVPVQLTGLFGQGDPVRSVAEGQVTREATTADVFRFAADRHGVRLIAQPLYDSCHVYPCDDFRYPLNREGGLPVC